MKNAFDRHYRVYDFKRDKFILTFYVFKGESAMHAMIGAMKQAGIEPIGEFRVDRMVWYGNKVSWKVGVVVTLQEEGKEET